MIRTLCSLNLNGIRAAEKRGFTEWLARQKPDVLCLQEVRAHVDQVPPELRCPSGYNTRWRAADRKGYAGVGIYSRPSADRYVPDCGLSWADEEGRCLRAEFGDVAIYSLYVPSGSSGEERLNLKFECMDYLRGFLAKVRKERRPVAICGDWNVAHEAIDIHNPKGNAKNSGFLPEERAWFSELLANGWVDVVRAHNPGVEGLYSWWSSRGRARELDRGWRLDYVLGNAAFARRVESAWIEKDAGLSDHAPVWVRLAES